MRKRKEKKKIGTMTMTIKLLLCLLRYITEFTPNKLQFRRINNRIICVLCVRCILKSPFETESCAVKADGKLYYYFIEIFYGINKKRNRMDRLQEKSRHICTTYTVYIYQQREKKILDKFYWSCLSWDTASTTLNCWITESEDFFGVVSPLFSIFTVGLSQKHIK